jgi:predicted MPP superfamily phosphohydrolase
MGSQESKSDSVLRVFAVSDLHTDAWEENRRLVESFTDYGPNDVLIVAGDVAEDLEVLRRTHSSNYCWVRLSETDAKISLVFEETLTTLSQSFGHVFYITGTDLPCPTFSRRC